MMLRWVCVAHRPSRDRETLTSPFGPLFLFEAAQIVAEGRDHGTQRTEWSESLSKAHFELEHTAHPRTFQYFHSTQSSVWNSKVLGVVGTIKVSFGEPGWILQLHPYCLDWGSSAGCPILVITSFLLLPRRM